MMMRSGSPIRVRHRVSICCSPPDAILTQLQVTETIANDKASYVEIAARLGMDGSLREEIVGRMVRGYPLLYSDQRNVTTLEEFFREQARPR